MYCECKPTHILFSPQKREGFCQLLQQMKNKHSEKPEPDMITVFVGTWNMGDLVTSHKLESI